MTVLVVDAWQWTYLEVFSTAASCIASCMYSPYVLHISCRVAAAALAVVVEVVVVQHHPQLAAVILHPGLSAMTNRSSCRPTSGSLCQVGAAAASSTSSQAIFVVKQDCIWQICYSSPAACSSGATLLGVQHYLFEQNGDVADELDEVCTIALSFLQLVQL